MNALRYVLPLVLLAGCDARSSLPTEAPSAPFPSSPSWAAAPDPALSQRPADTGREGFELLPTIDDCGDVLTAESMAHVDASQVDPLQAFEDWRTSRRTTLKASKVVDCLHRAWQRKNNPRFGRAPRVISDLLPAPGPNLDTAGGVPAYQGEIQIAVNPNNNQQLVAGANTFYQDPNSACHSPTGGASGTFGTQALYRSNDGGATWTYACAPWPQNLTGGVPGAAAWFGSDPALAWNSAGDAFATYMLISQDSFGFNTGVAIVVARWAAGGTGWLPFGTVVNNLSNTSGIVDDKEMIAVDTTVGGTFSHSNRIYVIWDENNVERVAHSDNNGAAWTTVVLPGGGTNIGGNLMILRDGTVVAAWNNIIGGSTQTGENTVVSISTDGGMTWSAPRVAATHRLFSFGNNHTPPAQDSRGVNAFPALTADTRNGSPTIHRIYVVYADFPTGVTSGNDINIYETWASPTSAFSTPVQVNDDSPGATQFFPWAAVDQSDSSLSVAWYDTRNNAPNYTQTQIYYARSNDSGQTFSANVNVGIDDGGNGFANHVNFSDENSVDNANFNPNQYGDYMGIAVANRVVHVAWTDSRDFYPTAGDARVEDMATCTIYNPDFALTATPSPLTIITGQSGTETIQINSFGQFNGPVALSCNNPPAGVTCAFSPSPATPPANGMTNSTLTVSVAMSTVPGSFTITVNGVNTNTTRTATFQLVVTSCGNRITEPANGETCDDGNRVSGDGCSSTCLIEPRSADLATVLSDRQLIGSNTTSHLGNIAIGDINNDGFADLLVGEEAQTSMQAGGMLNYTGIIHGYLGSATFFSGASGTIPTGEAFEIQGPNNFAYLGGGFNGTLAIGDVTGDGIPDILAGAPGYNGVGGGRMGSGAVYCLNGQASLATAGTIDLSSATLPSFVRFTIVGAAAGDGIRVLGLGDIDGDGVRDVIVGAPNHSFNGRSANGQIYVVSGTGSGTIDLNVESDARILNIVRGAAANDHLGATTAAIGDVNGDNLADLAVSSPFASPGGITAAGTVWVIFGHPARIVDLNAPLGSGGAAFLGEYNYDGLGQSVAIGQVRGSVTPDLVIGVRDGWNDTSNNEVGYVDVWTGPIAAGLHQYNTTTMPGTRIYGRATHSLIGNSIALADLNADGFMDIVTGAPGAGGPSGTRTNAGDMTVMVGSQMMTAVIDLVTFTAVPMQAYGPISGSFSGINAYSVAAGDLNGDGRPDYAVGSPWANNGNGQVDAWRCRW